MTASQPHDPAARAAYSEMPSAEQMREDCRAVGANLRLEQVRDALAKPAPGITFEEYPREVRKREIRVSEAAQRLANALHLHLD